MAREFEVVSNPKFKNLHVFLVRMTSRTPHIHRELEIGFVLRGSVWLRIGDENLLLHAMDGYRINPLEAHAFRPNASDAIILAVQVSPRVLDAFLSEAPCLRYAGSAQLSRAIAKERDYAELFRLCVELAERYLEQNTGCELDCFALTASILALLNRALPSGVLPKDAWKPIRQRMERILSVTDYIDENYQHKLLLEEIAKRESITMTYLSHLFQEVLGMSFQNYLKKKRFEHARPLILGTNRNLLDISLESGFSDARYMIRMFEEEFGCTPKAYRKSAQHRKNSEAVVQGNAQSILDADEALRLLEGVRASMR